MFVLYSILGKSVETYCFHTFSHGATHNILFILVVLKSSGHCSVWFVGCDHLY